LSSSAEDYTVSLITETENQIDLPGYAYATASASYAAQLKRDYDLIVKEGGYTLWALRAVNR
jgi:hypothetical protein